MITLIGKKVSGGIAIGPMLFYQRDLRDIRRINVQDVEKEMRRLERAEEKAQLELEELHESAIREVGEINAGIFELQQHILEDQQFQDEITKIITEQKLNAEYAVHQGTAQFLTQCKAGGSAFDSSNEIDIQDVSLRVIRNLSRSWRDQLLTNEPFILGAEELYPSEIIDLDLSQVKGFVTMKGTVNSHTAVLARTRGIPAVFGLGEGLKEEYDSKTIIVDGTEGKIYLEPDRGTLDSMRKKQQENHAEIQNLEQLKGKENKTQSGQAIDVCANIERQEDIESVLRSDATGVGLYRTESLYLDNGEKLPTEEQQYQAYQLAAESMQPRRVVIRTADLGGKNVVPALHMDPEDNPTMGLRGIRLSLEKEELFKTQLRAILRAAVSGNVAILLPMITSVQEVQRVKYLIEQAKKELKDEKAFFASKVPLGVMVETPAAVMISGDLAREVDFLCIGANDLSQFVLAMDRENKNLNGFYDSHHPALLNMIRVVINNAHLEGKKVLLCGDLAEDLTQTEFFLQSGVDALSVAPEQVLEVRKKIRDI